METPQGLYYTKDHEWAKLDGDVATIGITEYAQGELGDVVFVELPAIGKKVEMGGAFGTIEAVKAVADLYAPLSGSIVAVNSALENSPELVNQSPYGDGWMVKINISDKSEIDKLMNADVIPKRLAVLRDGLFQIGENIRAVIFSHGHLDHIGAAAILLKKLDNPNIIGRPLTMEMIKHRVEDHDRGSSKKLKIKM